MAQKDRLVYRNEKSKLRIGNEEKTKWQERERQYS